MTSGASDVAMVRARRSDARVSPRRRSAELALQRVGDLASVLGELDHDLLVQPDVHLRGVVHVAAVVQLLSKLLACGAAPDVGAAAGAAVVVAADGVAPAGEAADGAGAAFAGGAEKSPT